MKQRILLTCGTAALALWAGVVSASPYGDEVVSQLTRQGFKNIQVETTWLGRERIVADRADGLREIILNPRSGEILRDTWTAAQGATAMRPIVDDVGDDSSGGTGGGSGKDGSGKDGSDDHQGSGGGSGSGSDGGSDGGSSGGSDGGSDGGGDHSDGKSGGDGSGGDGSGGDKGSDN